MTNITIDEFVAAVAVALGGEWTVGKPEGHDGPRSWLLEGPDEVRLRMAVSGRSNTVRITNRVVVTGVPELCDYRRKRARTIRATIAALRGAEHVARQIRQRFLVQYLPAYRKWHELRQAVQADRESKRALLEELVAIAGGSVSCHRSTVDEVMGFPMGDCEATLPWGTAKGERGGMLSITLNHVPLPHARHIVALMSGGCTKQLYVVLHNHECGVNYPTPEGGGL